MFELTDEEFRDLRSQIVTSKWGGQRYYSLAVSVMLLKAKKKLGKVEEPKAQRERGSDIFGLSRHRREELVPKNNKSQVFANV